MPLCKSHIIPEFIYSMMYDKKHRIMEMDDVKAGKHHLIQKGETEHLLCRNCESKLNKFEKHVRRLFVDALPKPTSVHRSSITLPNLNYRLFKLFLLSVVWRASISSRPIFRYVKLGPHEEIIRNLILREETGPRETYPCLVIPITFNGDHMPDIIVEPTFAKFDGHRYYRFVFGGFLFLVFVSSHEMPSSLKRSCLSDSGPLVAFPHELGDFRFLREMWNLAGEKSKNIVTTFGQE